MPFWVQIREHRTRFLKTLVLYSCYLSIGFSLGIVGPTLLDLRQQVQTGMREISFALTARAGGYALGSLAMGFAYPRLNFQLATVFCMSTSAVLTFAIPFVSTISVLLPVFVLNGFFLGSFEAGSNMFLLQLWGKENPPFMQALHLMYGLGALAIPLVVEPFLTETTVIEELDNTPDDKPEVFHPEKVRLMTPFLIIAVHLTFNAIISLLMWRTYPVTDEHPSRVVHVPRVHRSVSWSLGHKSEDAEPDAEKAVSNTRESMMYKKLVIALVILFMHIYYGLEITFGSFLMTFAVKSQLHLTKSDGAHLSSLFWSTFTFLRLFTVFYIEWVGDEVNILACLIVVLAANGVLVPYASHSESMLWIGVALIGIGTSSIWASVFGLMEKYFPVENMTAAGVIVAAILGEFIFPVVISTFVEDYPQVLLWVTLFCSLTISSLFLVIVVICRLKLKSTK